MNEVSEAWRQGSSKLLSENNVNVRSLHKEIFPRDGAMANLTKLSSTPQISAIAKCLGSHPGRVMFSTRSSIVP